MNNIKDAVKLYLESLLAHDESIPEEDITIKPLKVISHNFCKKRVAWVIIDKFEKKRPPMKRIPPGQKMRKAGSIVNLYLATFLQEIWDFAYLLCRVILLSL